ncbi:MAG: hypothetical protein ACWA6X_04465 [Bauldia sp.]
MLGGLITTRAERKAHDELALRAAFRRAQRSADRLRGDAERLRRDRDASWLAAKTALRDGDKGGAQRQLQSIRAADVQITQLDRRHWSIQRIVSKLRISQTDRDATEALRRITETMRIEPDRLDTVFAGVSDMYDDQAEAERIWEAAYRTEMDGVEAESPAGRTVDDMMRDLEQEVAVDLRGEADRTAARAAEFAGEIAAERERLKSLLGDAR